MKTECGIDANKLEMCSCTRCQVVHKNMNGINHREFCSATRNSNQSFGDVHLKTCRFMWMKEWSLKNILCKKDKRKSIANLKATSVLRYLFSFQINKIVLQLKKT